MRPSLLLTVEGRRFLIDAGPEFRIQALRYGVEFLDGVILTHSHYDHVGGIDDLRIFSFHNRKPLPCLLSRETFDDISRKYGYLTNETSSGIARFAFRVLPEERGKEFFGGIPVHYFSYRQKKMKVTGIRVGHLAYVVDILTYEEHLFTHLKGVTTLIIDGMAWERKDGHLGISEIIPLVKTCGIERTFLTHISHEVDPISCTERLPEGMVFAYDGLEVEV